MHYRKTMIGIGRIPLSWWGLRGFEVQPGLGEVALDEGADAADEGEEGRRCVRSGDAQAAAAIEPGHGAHDHPAVPAQVAGRLGAPAGDAREGGPVPQPIAQMIEVTAPVCRELGWVGVTISNTATSAVSTSRAT